MGLRDMKAKAIEAAAEWYGRDWFRRAEAGEKGRDMQEATLWVKANKVTLSVICKVLSGLLASLLADGLLHGNGWKIAVGCLFYFGGVLLGGGAMNSDAREHQKLVDLREAKADEAEGRF